MTDTSRLQPAADDGPEQADVATPQPEAPRPGAPIRLAKPIELDAPSFYRLLVHVGIDIRLNVRSSAREWRSRDYASGEWTDWKPASDELEAELVDQLNRNGTFSNGLNSKGEPRIVSLHRTGNFHETCLAICSQREVDPLITWLDTIPDWDGTPRLGTLLEDLFGFGGDVDPGLAAWAGAYPFIGAIERARAPGSKIDELPVLVGPQGSGKSTLLRLIFPETLQHWAFAEFSFDLNEQQRVERTDGAVIVEITEMGGSTSARSREDIKSWLSRQHDKIRRAYRANAATTPRRFVHVGTTNRRDSLPNDPSGNRRFAVVELGDGGGFEAVVDHMEANRAQLWAEAVSRHARGERAHLPAALKTVAAEVAEGHRYRSSESLEDAISDSDFNHAPMTLAEIKKALSGTVDEAELRRDRAIRAALEANGWIAPTKTSRHPVTGKHGRYYLPPYDSSEYLFGEEPDNDHPAL